MYYSPILQSGKDAPERCDLRELFGNDHPVELEIGCGKGLFLMRESLRQQAVNFLGIEWSLKHARMAAARLAKHHATNTRIFSADAREFMHRLDDRSISAVHIYFPDPWWKRRHQKRRIVTPEFTGQLARVIQPGGHVSLATDVESYFQIMLAVFGPDDRFQRMSDPEPAEPCHDLDYLTHFERKYRHQGREIHRCRFRRTSRTAKSV